ncbi:gamma-secretase subunit APH-1B-like [Rhopilema esculentum]|uniref:gamma-secretase subunit APH-1B-like n=1 Tax=Rhopilema esculentum TaxID=499914 RepID=UPI0031D0844A|eukprot:gene12900-3652_t
MTALMFFGCSFLGFGPALALFVLTVAPDAQQVIVMITSSFFWLLALFLSSLFWIAVVPLKSYLVFGVTFSVLFQELFRLAFWKILKKAEEGLISITGSHSPLRKLRFHYVSGLGFGIMSGLFAMVNVMADITGPGTVGLYGDYKDFLVVTALLTNCFVLLNTCWGILFYDGLEKRCWFRLTSVLLSHMLVSLLTVLNSRGLYLVPLLVNYGVLVVYLLWALKVVGVSFANVKKSVFPN